MRLGLLSSLLLVVSTCTLLAGCSKENNVDQSTKTTNNYSALIGPKGGKVGDTASLGAFITVGAVDEETTFSVREATAGEYPTPPSGTLGSIYSFEPHGVRFNTVVDVFLPDPGVPPLQPFAAYHAAPGGDWEQLPPIRDSGSSNFRVETRSFSFFLIATAGSGPGAGTGGGTSASAGAGAVGAGPGGTGAGGTPSTGSGGGPAGTGGSSGGSCELDDAAPLGTSDATGDYGRGSVKVPFTAVDGYAVLTKGNELTLVFSDKPSACGIALGSGGAAVDQSHQASGPANGTTLAVTLRGSAGGVTKGTYPGGAIKADVIALEQNATCTGNAEPQPSDALTLVIDEIDGVHVAGTIQQYDLVSEGTFSGSFDFPVCPLPETPQAPACCIQ